MFFFNKVFKKFKISTNNIINVGVAKVPWTMVFIFYVALSIDEVPI